MKTLLICFFGVLFFYGHGAQSKSCITQLKIPTGRFSGHWQNAFDKPLDYMCNDNGPLTGMRSVHDNGREDRRFDFACSSSIDRQGSANCEWSPYGIHDKQVHYNCPPNNYLAGWKSHHNNQMEDRLQSFKCCRISNLILRDCRNSGYVNEYDKPARFLAPANYVIAGVHSVHDNGKEDRRFSFTFCHAGLVENI